MKKQLLLFSLLVFYAPNLNASVILCAHSISGDTVPIESSSMQLENGESLGVAPVIRLAEGASATGTDARGVPEVAGPGRFLSFLTQLFPDVQIDSAIFDRTISNAGGWDLRSVENFTVSPDRTRVAFSQWGDGTGPFYMFDSKTNKLLSGAVEFDNTLARQTYEKIGSQISAEAGGADAAVRKMQKIATGGSGIFPFRHMNFSPDGSKLVVDAGSVFTVFNGQTLEPLWQFSAGLPVNGAAWFLGEGDYIMSIHELGIDGGNANLLMIWDADAPTLLRTQTIDKGFIPSGLSNWGGTGSNIAGRGVTPGDPQGRYWVRTVQTIPNFSAIINQPDGLNEEERQRAYRRATSKHQEYQETNVWEIGRDREGPRLQLVKSFVGTSVEVDPHGVSFSNSNRAIVGSPKGTVQVFSLPDWALTHTLTIDGANSGIRSSVISGDGNVVAAITRDFKLAFWSLKDGQARALGYYSMENTRIQNFAYQNGGGNLRIFFSDDSKTLHLYMNKEGSLERHAVKVPQ